VVVLLGVLELGARVARVRTPFFLLPGPENCLQRDPLLSLSFRPGCAGELSQTVFRTNALGLRGPEVRDEGARRILAIGDSCTWGWRVAQEESYPAALQRLLDAGGAGRAQVINAGVPGYTSYQGLLYLGERGLALGPAAVVLAYGFNDTATVGDIELQLARERRLLPLLEADDLLMRRSTLYRWLRWQANANPTGLPARVTPEKYGRNVAQMLALIRERGARPIVLSFWDERDQPNAGYRAALAAVVRTHDVPVITYDGPLLDVIHPTAEGYRTLATRLLAQLERDGVVAAGS
jgi:lysophospholipase L1-like esterase